MNNWIVLKVNDMRIEVTDSTGGTRISLRLDDDETSACTHYWNYYNGAGADTGTASDDDTEYLHICDFSEFITELQELDALRQAVKRGEVGVTDCPHECVARSATKSWCQACGQTIPSSG